MEWNPFILLAHSASSKNTLDFQHDNKYQVISTDWLL